MRDATIQMCAIVIAQQIGIRRFCGSLSGLAIRPEDDAEKSEYGKHGEESS
jgi:hypothetical protein